MTIQEAIQLAVDGGYHTAHGRYLPASDIGKQVSNDDGFLQKCLLDPLFWQALGRGIGWDADLCPTCGGGYRISARMVDWCENYCENDGFPTAPRPGWQYHWHRFIDHLASGKSIEDFFANLLPHE